MSNLALLEPSLAGVADEAARLSLVLPPGETSADPEHLAQVARLLLAYGEVAFCPREVAVTEAEGCLRVCTGVEGESAERLTRLLACALDLPVDGALCPELVWKFPRPLPEDHFQLVVPESDQLSWQSYVGPHGGHGYKNAATGEVRYQQHAPTEGGGAAAGPEGKGGHGVHHPTKLPTTPEGLHQEAEANATKIEKAHPGLLNKLGAAGKWLRGKTQEVYKALEKRYGRRAALTIFASGFVTGMLPPVVFLPGSTLLMMAPFAALAEVYLQAKRGYQKLTGEPR
jgi:hypothetical protein